jgi:DNA-binding response OmpR family regulator
VENSKTSVGIPTASAGEKKSILIVEDEISLSSALNDKLTLVGYDVALAKNGQEGLDAIKKHKPDLILLDVVMPVMDGMTMLRELHKTTETQDIPVIILSNLSDNQDVLHAMENNTYDYLIKSDISLEAVLERVKAKLEANKS